MENQFKYLLHDTLDYCDYRLQELETMSKEQILAEYERICLAEESLIETKCLIENIGWLRHDDSSRKYVYSTYAAREVYDICLKSTRVNAHKNLALILQDQKSMLELIAYKQGYNELAQEFWKIDNKYANKFNEFWQKFSITQ